MTLCRMLRLRFIGFCGLLKMSDFVYFLDNKNVPPLLFRLYRPKTGTNSNKQTFLRFYFSGYFFFLGSPQKSGVEDEKQIWV